MNQKRKHSPNGINHKAIALRLMPDERKEAVELSGKLNLSHSAFARKVYLRGIPLVREDIASDKA